MHFRSLIFKFGNHSPTFGYILLGHLLLTRPGFPLYSHALDTRRRRASTPPFEVQMEQISLKQDAQTDAKSAERLRSLTEEVESLAAEEVPDHGTGKIFHS